ncbi:MAG: phosphoribosylformylglycinamidine synthase [Oscillospiraceae bacterium]|nr:phosphoribosylformylglycinamidine synthase [Oscillospiraceae bacterium]
MAVFCLYVEKKKDFAVEALGILNDLRDTLGAEGIDRVRVINRYLLEGISAEVFLKSRNTILGEPRVDNIFDSLPSFGESRVFAVELLPGQFDQRADSCAQCVSLISGGERPMVRCARIIVLEGDFSLVDYLRIKRHLINPVESREASLILPETLEASYPAADDVAVLGGFKELDGQGLADLHKELGMAMDAADLSFCRDYFKQEDRDPTITELRVIDTYWSDHCRHTTFLTRLEDIAIEDPEISAAHERYLNLREELGISKPVTLMDMATIGAKAMKARGCLERLDQSEEINACSVNLSIDVDGKPEDWLLMFKNETHNHPTEIEPFGGAATCLGGAIRDPLSGRSYVHQAMRITGAASPLKPSEETRKGKLSQRKICRTAAAGYSSYGNQIGLATGLVHEIYHPGYEAKRMELGAVVGAAPARDVLREKPRPSDKIILLGGRTGRDGCGGATGSSRAHTEASLESCGSEVQKGNPPEERKLQRLFRNPEAVRLIRRCNDFGAGGVSVAIGELADGVRVNLDKIPLKYEGLSGTELAISESQERMAAVVSAEDAQTLRRLADQENLEAMVVAEVTAEPELVMLWRGKEIVRLRREFLSSNGAPKFAGARVPAPCAAEKRFLPATGPMIMDEMASLRFCSRRGLAERFDSTIGAGSVLLPYGGKYQRTPSQVMAAKFPVLKGETEACSIMSFAFDPDAATISPYHAAMDSVVESVAKVIAAGGKRSRSWLTFQEYYEKPECDPLRWGRPAAALLGALTAQLELQIAAIGGKDSMSGSFEELSVPPTLVSVAVSASRADKIVSDEFKAPGSPVYLLSPSRAGMTVNFDDVRFILDTAEELLASGRVRAARAVGTGGSAEAVCSMCFGNMLGFRADKPLSFSPVPGAILIEAKEHIFELDNFLLGETVADYRLILDTGEEVSLKDVQHGWENTLRPVYPDLAEQPGKAEPFTFEGKAPARAPGVKTAQGAPVAAIPVFPGTNCEYDTARAFENAGIKAEIFVLRNLTPRAISESVEGFAALVARSNIVALPGGFSAGDEPEGSAKFIAAFMRNPVIKDKVEELLYRRDGLMLGICNGFQALVRLGLVPFGEYREPGEDMPTLTHNVIGRHQSRMVRTRIASAMSPWLCGMEPGEVYTVPVSHGEGRFIADDGLIRQMAAGGQVATQYVGRDNMPSMDIEHNPNGSAFAIEGITSPDGRVLGKMGHNERWGPHLYKNMPFCPMLDIFRCAARYYR